MYRLNREQGRLLYKKMLTDSYISCALLILELIGAIISHYRDTGPSFVLARRSQTCDILLCSDVIVTCCDVPRVRGTCARPPLHQSACSQNVECESPGRSSPARFGCCPCGESWQQLRSLSELWQAWLLNQSALDQRPSWHEENTSNTLLITEEQVGVQQTMHKNKAATRIETFQRDFEEMHQPLPM